MSIKDFGKFVRNERERRSGYYEAWTRAYLAQRANLSTQTVERIENGGVKDLRPYVEPLAQAFKLNEFQKAEFYALAGFVYEPALVDDDLEYQIGVLEKLRLPAATNTTLWDIAAMNEYDKLFWNYSDDDIRSMQEDVLGANILRLVFDTSLHSTQTLVRSPDIHERVVLLFRTGAFRHKATRRYDEIVAHMLENFPLFDDIWHKLERKKLTAAEHPLLKELDETIEHPSLGKMEAMGLSLPRRFIGGTIVTSIYMPLQADGGVELLAKLHQQVNETGNKVYRFPYKPVV